MASTVTNTPNVVRLLPTSLLTSPASYTVAPSGTAVSVLGDASDSSYVQQIGTSSNNWFRVRVQTTALPTGSRVLYARAVGRAGRTGTSKRQWYIQLSTTGKNGLGITGSATVSSLNTTFGTYASPPIKVLADGKTPIDQAAITAGFGILFGEKPGTAAESVAFRTSDVWAEVSYDKPPTATVTTSGTFNDTSSPLIQWDYFDDLQAQSQYQVVLVNSVGKNAYDSGLVKSSDSFHQVSASLPNDTYSVQVRVYQAWSGAGGVFPSVAAAVGSIVVSVLPLPVPNLLTTTESVGKNFVLGDASVFASSLSGWSASSGTVTRDGAVGCTALGSMKLNASSSANLALAVPSSKVPLIFKVSALLTGGVTAANVDFYVTYYNASNAFLMSAPGRITTTTDPNNAAWTRFTVSDTSIPPTTTAYAIASVRNTNTTSALWVDDIFLGIYNTDQSSSALTFTDPFAATVFVNNHINLLNVDDSSFDNGFPGWQSISNATLSTVSTPVVAGQRALKVTVPAAGWAQLGQYVAAVKWSSASTRIAISAQVSGPTTATGKQVLLGVNFYDSSFALISQTNTGLPASAGYSLYLHTAGVPASTAYVSVTLSVTNCAASDVFYVDNVMVSDYLDTTVPWSRGGLISNTLNQMSYNDSTMAVGSNWVSNNASTLAVISTDQARQGTTSLKLTRLSTTGQIDCDLGNSVFYSVDQSMNSYAFIGWVYSPTVSRTASMVGYYYDANFVQIGSGFSHDVTTVVGQWIYQEATAAPPANAAYLSVRFVVANAAANESHYFDTAAVYALANASQFNQRANLGWQAGRYPKTDTVPVVDIQYRDQKRSGDFGDWTELATIPLLDANGVLNPILTTTDYSIRSGVPRQYTAVVTKTENGVTFTSSSGLASASIGLDRVWLHAVTDPARSIASFAFDGNGRTEQVSSLSNTTVVEGRPYGFTEYGNQKTASVQVSLQALSYLDKESLERIANWGGNVVFRDARGRCYTGPLGEVSFTDQKYGFDASFTMNQSGDL